MAMEQRVTDVQERVAAIAASVTGVPPAEPDAPLGLDSLQHAEVALALEEELGVHVPDDAALDTVRAAAASLDGAGPDVPPALEVGIGRLQGGSMAALGPVLRPLYRLRVTGADRVPTEGPVILASNHDSLLDIPFLVLATPRPVWFMAKVELYRGPAVSRLWNALGGFPVRRQGNDLRAIRAALEVVEGGHALGMYPEGTRSHEFLPFLGGAAWVAVRTGSPLVPVGVRGTAEALPRGAKIPRRTHVTVAFGEPIRVDAETEARARLARVEEVTRRLREDVGRLTGASSS